MHTQTDEAEGQSQHCLSGSRLGARTAEVVILCDTLRTAETILCELKPGSLRQPQCLSGQACSRCKLGARVRWVSLFHETTTSSPWFPIASWRSFSAARSLTRYSFPWHVRSSCQRGTVALWLASPKTPRARRRGEPGLRRLAGRKLTGSSTSTQRRRTMAASWLSSRRASMRRAAPRLSR